MDPAQVQTRDSSYVKTTFNSSVNPGHISYTTDGKNRIDESQENPHASEYGLRMVVDGDKTNLQVTVEKFPTVLNTCSVFTELYLQHTKNGRVENWHLCLRYKAQDQRVVELFNSSIEGQKMRPDQTGLTLHLDPELTPRDKQFFEKGEYQTKYIPAIKLILTIAQKEKMLEVDQADKLRGILQINNLV